jgi:Tol biopolymer transport system component
VRVETVIRRALSIGILLAWASNLCFSGYIVKFDHDSKIVFSSNFEGNEDIYLLTRNQLTKLTDDPATDQWPVPDSKGESIVFTSNRSGNYDVYLMNLKSRDIKRLTLDSRDEMAPSWSADDRFIYFDLNVKGDSWRTMKMDARTGTTTPLFPDPPYSSTIVAFESRNGNEVFFTGKVFLGWLVAKFDKARGAYAELAKKGSCRPKVSPDGSLVAYVAHDDDGLGDVFVMAPDGAAKRNLTRSRSRTHDYYPCFSPDGRMIVFSSSPKGKGKNAYQLHTLDLGSGEVKSILTTSGNDRFPYWFK